MNWKSTAIDVRWNIQPLIEGRYRPSQSGETFDDINPSTEAPLCQVAVGSAADVDEAVRVARRRFEDGCWSELMPTQRCEILLKLAELIIRDKVQIALLDSLEMGKPVSAALYDAEQFAPTLLRAWAGFADKLLGQAVPIIGGNLQFTTFVPRGVVGAITPWNFPSVCAIYKIAPALAAGNTVVVKPSELSSASALKIAELALEAGIPEGVVNIVPGLGTTVGAALASHLDVNFLSFTGSTVTGRKIMEMAARSNGKPVMLELGGKSPQVVFEDADHLDRVADGIVQSFLWNSGQVCSAHTRLVVNERIKDALLEKIIARVSTQKPDDPLDEKTTLGPLASPAQRDRVRNYIEQGLKAGAVAVLKGAIQDKGGCYVAPTIFDRVTPTMSIVREEIFGPVLCVQVFKDEAEAIALANGTDYGLGATVWTRDMGCGKRMAHAIRAGHVSVRTSGEEAPTSPYVVSREPQKASGFGSEQALRGLQSYSTLKSMSFSGA